MIALSIFLLGGNQTQQSHAFYMQCANICLVLTTNAQREECGSELFNQHVKILNSYKHLEFQSWVRNMWTFVLQYYFCIYIFTL